MSDPPAVPDPASPPPLAEARAVLATVAALLLFQLALAAVLTGAVVAAWVGGGGKGAVAALPALGLLGSLCGGLLSSRAARVPPDAVEVREGDEPALAALVRRVAEQVDAPPPEHLFLVPGPEVLATHEVAARRGWTVRRLHLVLGLARIDTGTEEELAAAVADALRPFARHPVLPSRARAARSLAEHLVTHRGPVDRWLDRVSADLRVAWIAWPPQALAWSVRAVTGGLLRAARPTWGSLGAAAPIPPAVDEAWSRTLALLAAAAREGEAVTDAWVAHGEMIRRLALARGEEPGTRRSAWPLLRDPLRTRALATERLLGPEAGLRRVDPTGRVDALFDAVFLQPRFRGLHLGRSVVRAARHPASLVGELPEHPDRDQVLARIDAALPEAVGAETAAWRARERRVAQLAAVGGAELERARAEAAEARSWLEARDRELRTAHRLAARLLSPEWERSLAALLALLHLLEHVRADLVDAGEALAVAVRAARTSGAPRRHRETLAGAARRAWVVGGHLYALEVGVAPPVVDAPRTLRALLPPDPQLPPPAVGELGRWRRAFDAWLAEVDRCLGGLAADTLDALLSAEDHVATSLRAGADPGPAPLACVVPDRHPTLVLGEERTAASTAPGPIGGLAEGLRWVAAAGVIAASLAVSRWSPVGADVTVRNGLRIPVVVQLGEEVVHVAADGAARARVPSRRVAVQATTEDGRLIERFEEELVGPSARPTVYDVASAALLAQRTVTYGAGPQVDPAVLGTPRWTPLTVDYPLGVAPVEVRGRWGARSATRTVLAADGVPTRGALLRRPTEERAALLRAHLRWDPATSLGWTVGWIDVGDLAVLEERSDRAEHRVVLGKLAQDVARQHGDGTVCAAQVADAELHPEDPARALLAARCAGDDALLALFSERPDDPDLRSEAVAALARSERWEEAARLAMGRPDPDGRALRLCRRAGIDPPAPPFDPARLDVLAVEGDPGAARAAAAAQPELELALLLAGGVADAASLAAAPPEVARRMRPLVAASDGPVDPGLVASALEEARGTQDWSDALAVAALAVREGRAVDPAALGVLRSLPDGALLERALDPALLRRPGWLDQELRGADPATRGRARLLGSVVLGEEAPATWREEARTLLLPWERPYLGR